MSSVSGLSEAHRAEARRIIARGCELLLAHAREVHYSQETDRWQGIDHKLRITHGQFPRYCDCSSTASWLLWNALVAHFPDHPVRDVVNGTRWTWGWTGTMLEHGKRVVHEANIKIGDLIHYRGHVAVALGGGVAFSHGSEGGPYIVPIHYRPDFLQARRHI